MPTTKEIAAYLDTVSVPRIRLSQVPEQFKPAVKAFQEVIWGEYGTSYIGLHNGRAAALATADDNQKIVKGNCTRCGGVGRIEAYKHIDGGMCFACGGSGSSK